MSGSMKFKNLTFNLIEKKPKTNIYSIVSNHSDEELGRVFWYPAWRRYVCQSFENIIWSSECLKELTDFLEAVNSEHKNKLEKEKN